MRDDELAREIDQLLRDGRANAQPDAMERALWVAVRRLEERVRTLERITGTAEEPTLRSGIGRGDESAMTD
ncbi:hypothetical protein SMD20_32505 [Nonomuraea sp. LP-02]|uniref:hypothetical protein n=1 Tax=Nonomuraea sp. LP-02 TaxID=3097960 RepID=UPI002E2F1B34|nr:hypothetical protein [Nonomuraea sp. LP-02]MED7929009.1 hypothetical protein [Nonomuraea sp. LP-02]